MNREPHSSTAIGSVDLLRHGQTRRDDIFRGRTDDPLTDAGYRQMQSAVGDAHWDRVICSPLSRCQQFAEHIADGCGVVLEQETRFREYDFGDWDGRTYTEVMRDQASAVERFFADPCAAPPPNGEDFTRFQQRVLTAWRELLEQAPQQRTLVVSHGGVIMVVLAEVLGVDRLHGRIEMAYACHSRIRLDPSSRRPRLVSHG